ncbi:T9SS type A sorting domain-containing protein [Psychroserpens sp.]|uniref:T9SS type A sorting domain-containing protein n=1 Tax=Psychroserpens sp. TaxID=2020870 RepID=UPI003C74E088
MKNFTKFLIPIVCGATALIGTDANAFQNDSDGCFGASVVSTEQGLTSGGDAVPANRSDSSTTLNAPDMSNAAGGFYSLGVGGNIVIEMGGAVVDMPGNDIKIYETSFSGDTCGLGDDESARVEVSFLGGPWVDLGVICRDGEVDIAGSGLPFVTQVRITDTGESSGDGYDVDGIVALNGCGNMPDTGECFASTSMNYNPGLMKNGNPITDPERIDPSKAYGAPQNDDTNNFVSLGYEGEITMGFSGKVVYNGPGNDIQVVETTFGNHDFASYPESADVQVSQDGFNYYSVGTAFTNESAAFDIDAAGVPLAYIRFIKLIDSTPADSQSTDGYDLDGIIALTGCNDLPFQDPGFCNDFRTFYSDIPINTGNATIYTVDFSNGMANLNFFAELDSRSHIAFNTDSNVIYAVNGDGSGFDTLDALGTVTASTAFSPALGATPTAVYHAGKLIVGSQGQNKIVEVDIATGTHVDIATNVPVSGGDLIVSGTDLYLATKTGDKMFLIDGGTNVNGVNIPAEVNGAAIDVNGNILMSNRFSTAFNLLDTMGNTIASYPVFLDGESFEFRHGDMASGCASGSNDPNVCESTELVNGGFEDLAEGYTISNEWDYVPQDEVPGWMTTSPTGTIEIQENNGTGDNIPSNSGNHHFELNGDALNNLYQEFCTTPGSNIEIAFSHKKRRTNGVDEMELYVGGDLATIESNTAIPVFSVDVENWETKSFVYTVPAGQNSTIIYFKAISGTNNTVGNLLDDISVSPTFQAATDFAAYLALLSTPEAAQMVTEIDMYPVPAKDRLNVKLNSQVGGSASYEIVSIMGQSFNRGSVEAYSGETKITADISNLADGVYFFVINMNGNTTTKQFVKAAR